MKTFKAFSKDGKTIPRDAMIDILRRELVPELAQRVVNCFDKNVDGKIDAREFLLMMSAMRSDDPEQTARGMFAIYDRDGNGQIDEKELTECLMLFARSRVLKILVKLQKQAETDPTIFPPEFDPLKDTITLTEEQQKDVVDTAKAIMANFDTDKNGSISLEEFTKGCNGKHFTIFMKTIEDTARTARIDIVG